MYTRNAKAACWKRMWFCYYMCGMTFQIMFHFFRLYQKTTVYLNFESVWIICAKSVFGNIFMKSYCPYVQSPSPQNNKSRRNVFAIVKSSKDSQCYRMKLVISDMFFERCSWSWKKNNCFGVRCSAHMIRTACSPNAFQSAASPVFSFLLNGVTSFFPFLNFCLLSERRFVSSVSHTADSHCARSIYGIKKMHNL